MPVMTVLELTQEVIKSLNGQEVNSINDTPEAESIVAEAKKCFFDFTNRNLFPSNSNLIQMEALGDLDKPNYLRMPVGIKELTEIKYDCRQDADDTIVNYKNLQFVDPFTFIQRYSSNVIPRYKEQEDIDKEFQLIEDFSGFKFYIRLNKNPSEYTTFDNKHIVLNSLDKSIENTIQKNKTAGYAFIEPEWKSEDDFVIPLDSMATTAFLSEVVAACWIIIKDETNQREEARAQRSYIGLQNKRNNLKGSTPWFRNKVPCSGLRRG